MTGYMTKSFEDGRSIKVYISKEAPIRPYFTIVAIPDGVDAFCRVQRTPMRFRADAVQSTTDALKQCIFSYSRGFITTV